MGTARRPQPKKLPMKLLKIRQLFGLTQQEMASQLNHLNPPPQPGQISRFEQGKREPSLLVLLEYARMAGVHMEVLVDDKLDLPKKLSITHKDSRKTAK